MVMPADLETGEPRPPLASGNTAAELWHRAQNKLKTVNWLQKAESKKRNQELLKLLDPMAPVDKVTDFLADMCATKEGTWDSEYAVVAIEAYRGYLVHAQSAQYFTVYANLAQYCLLFVSIVAVVMASLSNQKEGSNTYGTVTIVLTAISSFVSGYSAIVQPSRRAQQHEHAASAFSTVYAEIIGILRLDRPPKDKSVDSCFAKVQQVVKESPTVAPYAVMEYHKGCVPPLGILVTVLAYFCCGCMCGEMKGDGTNVARIGPERKTKVSGSGGSIINPHAGAGGPSKPAEEQPRSSTPSDHDSAMNSPERVMATRD